MSGYRGEINFSSHSGGVRSKSNGLLAMQVTDNLLNAHHCMHLAPQTGY